MAGSESEGKVGLRPEHLQTMKGGAVHPTYDGVLNLATAHGLKSIVVSLVQIPSAENGHLAIVMARVEMEDGRIFTDIGDCSPASCGPLLAPHALRLASTRAKGRALRDAVNVGEAIAEEMGEGLSAVSHPPSVPAKSKTAPVGTDSRQPMADSPNAVMLICQHDGCEKLLDQGERTISTAKMKANLLSGGPYCRAHIDQHTRTVSA